MRSVFSVIAVLICAGLFMPPAAGDPVAGDPVAGDPVAGNPVGGGPSRGDPAEAFPMKAWWVDSLAQLLESSAPADTRIEGRIDVARGEVEAIQLAVRAGPAGGAGETDDNDAIRRVRAAAEPFGAGLAVRIRAVGRVPIVRGTHRTPVEERVAAPPVALPDPLFPRSEIELAPGRTESFWLDVAVPAGTAPGTYRTEVALTAGGETMRLPLILEVHAAAVPFECSMDLTNWFSVRPKDMGFGDAAPGSDEWWECARLLFDSMWAHRQNMFWTPLTPPWIRPVKAPDGSLAFDFTFFDRWVEEFSRPRGGERVTYIEGQPIAARHGGYDGKVMARVWRISEGVIEQADLQPDDPAARAGYAAFLTALRDHLKNKGWIDRFRIHICDEPHGAQLEPYAVVAGYVREFAPELRIMEALDVRDDFAFFEKNCDVWVPQLGRFEKSLPRMQERLARGEEVWIYTCLFPNGSYPNRFVDYHLIKTRILKWIVFQWDFSGYLHWGFNHWRGDPFENLEPHHHGKTHLPAGDAWIVYPGERAVLDSIRHEAMRDGIEDCELLKLLAARDPGRARDLAGSVVRTFTDYEREPAAFREVRRALLKTLSTTK
jgi:hypothetical protein